MLSDTWTLLCITAYVVHSFYPTPQAFNSLWTQIFLLIFVKVTLFTARYEMQVFPNSLLCQLLKLQSPKTSHLVIFAFPFLRGWYNLLAMSSHLHRDNEKYSHLTCLWKLVLASPGFWIWGKRSLKVARGYRFELCKDLRKQNHATVMLISHHNKVVGVLWKGSPAVCAGLVLLRKGTVQSKM